MGRTIHYELLASRTLRWDEWKEIRAAQAVMNHRCTWTCEELTLEQLEDGRRDEYKQDHHGDAPPIAWGFTKVAGDEWNAALVIAFAVWLSTRFRDMTVRLHEEGDLLRAGYFLIRGGSFVTDLARIDRQREYLKKHELKEYIAALDAAVDDAREGRIFTNVSIDEYRDRPEIVALGLSAADLRSLTVADVVKRLPIPWFDTTGSTT
ncbi:MAG: hypothetical protein ACHREM_09585 [Polyangiales bacterium]